VIQEKPYQSFSELEVGKKGRHLSNEFFELIRAFLNEEKY